MPYAVIHPEEPLESHLIQTLERARECRLAVAYLKRNGLVKLCQTAVPLLMSGTLRLRVVFQSADFVTEPDGVKSLLDLGKTSPDGTVEVFWSTDSKFHAKAYGFMPKGSKKPVVIIGSANASAKALGFSSGELCVRLSGTQAADDAWEAIGRMLNTSRRADSEWLKHYRKAFDKRKRLEKPARRIRADWMPKHRRTRRTASVARPGWSEDFVVQHVYSLDATSKEEIEDAIGARGPDEPRIPGRYLSWPSNPKRDMPEGKPVLLLWWRSEEEPKQGIRSASVVIPEKAIPLASPTTGRTKWWMIPYSTARGTQVQIPARNTRLLVELLFKSTGRTLQWLEGRNVLRSAATRK